MAELNTILRRVQNNFNNLNDEERSLAVLLNSRRINSGEEGVKVLIDGMTQKLEGESKRNASSLLGSLIARKNLVENVKRKATA